MIDRGDHAVRREEALHRALVAARLAPQDLEGAPLLLSRDGVDDRLPALAELSQDDERAELAAVAISSLPKRPATSTTRGSTPWRETRMTSISASSWSPSRHRSVSARAKLALPVAPPTSSGSRPRRRWLIEVISSSE